jgi:hypothetical protein
MLAPDSILFQVITSLANGNWNTRKIYKVSGEVWGVTTKLEVRCKRMLIFFDLDFFGSRSLFQVASSYQRFFLKTSINPSFMWQNWFPTYTSDHCTISFEDFCLMSTFRSYSTAVTDLIYGAVHKWRHIFDIEKVKKQL